MSNRNYPIPGIMHQNYPLTLLMATNGRLSSKILTDLL